MVDAIGAAGARGVPRRADAAVALLLALLALLLWHELPAGHWRGDDPAILLHALDSPGLRAFVDPAHWQQLSPSNLTPWATLSFRVDLLLGGPEPALFYRHQLAALALLVLVAYALGRQWLPPAWAAASVLLFLAGAPTAAVTEQLMTRHYLEGLLLALLALWAFVHALRRGSLPWACAGALAYAAACTSKEVYVPLVLLLPVLPSRLPLRARWRLLAPYGAVALAYVAWRRHMLGSTIGGYGDAAGLLALQPLRDFGAALMQVPAHLFGGWAVPALAVLAAATALALRARPALLPAAAVLVLGTLGPLVPLAASPGIHGPDRYLFLVWFVVAFGGVLALHAALQVLPWAEAPAGRLRPPQRWWSWQGSPLRLRPATGGLLLAALIAAAALQQHATGADRHAAQRAFDAVGRHLAGASAGDGPRQAFLPPPPVLATFWYVTSLCEMQRRTGGTCPQAVLPGFPLESPVEQLAVYDAAADRMVPAASTRPEALPGWPVFDDTRPLSVELQLDGGYARWRFGPQADGRWFVASPALGRLPLPREGQLRTTFNTLSLQVQHESPQGWATASPVLVLKPGQPLRWSREGGGTGR